MNHTSIKGEDIKDKCEWKKTSSVSFLDVSSGIKDEKIETDLYCKETDKNQCLLPSSCHPKQTLNSIPFSLGLRIVRVCSNSEDRDRRLKAGVGVTEKVAWGVLHL